MSCEVYANCNEIACKAGSCKTIAAFPDVCLSPPSPPAGPIPIPYPDTSFSKDMMNGSKTVKIKGQEVMLKDQSFYKTAPLGDEAATQGLGAGVVTHVITGKTHFKMWSMDVSFEGQNVDRHTDLTTSNHMAPTMGNSMIMATLGMMAMPGGGGETPPEDKCECCGKAPHSDAQEKKSPGKTLTEEQFYDPPPPGVPRGASSGGPSDFAQEFQNMKKKIEADGCQDILKTPPPPCNVFYVTTAKNVGDSRADFKEFKKTAEFQGWKEKQEKDSGQPCSSIGHRTPLAAGGCPTKLENLSCVPAKCADHENKLGILQGKIAQRHRSAPSK